MQKAGKNLSGTLTVTDGMHTANLTLLGQYAAGQYTSATDGHGGTLIGDPPPAQRGVATLRTDFQPLPIMAGENWRTSL
jgi:hypothetical protein